MDESPVRDRIEQLVEKEERLWAAAPPADSGNVLDPPNELEGPESEPPHLERGSPRSNEPAPDPGEPRDIP